MNVERRATWVNEAERYLVQQPPDKATEPKIKDSDECGHMALNTECLPHPLQAGHGSQKQQNGHNAAGHAVVQGALWLPFLAEHNPSADARDENDTAAKQFIHMRILQPVW
jgi:hypothetical protein